MEKQGTIISEWLAGKSKNERIGILGSMADQFSIQGSLPIEGALEQLAAVILAACAADLGLSTFELSGLLHEPRKDALAGLITVINE